VELLGLLGERVKVRRTANVLPGTYEATPTRRDRSVTQRLGQRLHQTESAAGVLHHLGARPIQRSVVASRRRPAKKGKLTTEKVHRRATRAPESTANRGYS